MLQIIREKAQGIIAWTIISLIIIIFALWGVDNFRADNKTIAATVNGIKISRQEVETLYQNYYQTMMRINPNMLKNMDPTILREQARQLLVGQAIFRTQMTKLGYIITDQQVMQQIINDPNFHNEGKFSVEKYKQVLLQFGHKEDFFENNIRMSLLAEQIQHGLTNSNIILPNEIERMAKLFTQTRNFGYVIIPAAGFQQEIKIATPEIEQYYQQHQQLFIAPEKIKISYLNLKLEELKKNITVTEAQLEEYYQQHQANYTSAESVNVRHIFINAPTDSALLKSGEAKAKIEDLLAQLKLGANFVTIAKKHSEDPISAIKGGELGFKGHGETTLEFEKAAFTLAKPGDISEIVQTEFGFHILQLIAHQPAKLKPLIEIKPLVMNDYQQEHAEIAFEHKAEELANLTFEHPDSLEQAALALNLTEQTSDWFTQQQGGVGLTAEPEVIAAAFEPEILSKTKNSEVLKLSPENYVVLRVIAHKPSEQQALAEVKHEIINKLTHEKALDLAAKFGTDMLTALKNGEPPHRKVAEKKLDWQSYENIERTDPKINAEIMHKVFTATLPKIGNYNLGFALTNGDYVVLSVSKINQPEIDKQKTSKYSKQLLAQLNKLEIQLSQNMLMRQAKVKLEN